LVTPRPLSAVVILVFRSRTEVRHETESGQRTFSRPLRYHVVGRSVHLRSAATDIMPMSASAAPPEMSPLCCGFCQWQVTYGDDIWDSPRLLGDL